MGDGEMPFAADVKMLSIALHYLCALADPSFSTLQSQIFTLFPSYTKIISFILFPGRQGSSNEEEL
jgi:hypothetical protein